MGESLRDRLARHFPADGLGWKIPSLAAALIFLITLVGEWAGIGSILSKSVRDAVYDLLTADVQVWHLLLAVAVVGVVGVLATRHLYRTTSAESPVETLAVPYPQEVKHFGVIWPIRTVLHGGTPRFRPDKPACPKDRTTLGMAVEDAATGKNVLVPLGDWWNKLVRDQMRFGCFKDGTIYDLTESGYGMERAIEIVVGQAEGEYRTTLARVRGKLD